MVKKLKKTIVWIAALAVIALAVLFIVLPKGAGAEEVTQFLVEGGLPDQDYTYENGVLTITTGTALTIRNANGVENSVSDTIVVADGISANITLAGVNIDVSGTDDACAFKIADNSTGNVTVTLAEGTKNTLKSGENCAGLQKNGEYTVNGKTIGKLTINGDGSLTVIGGFYAAGIGGGVNGSGSNITISGNAKVDAKGGLGTSGNRKIGIAGAGIGGGNKGSGTHITISGGTVTATGGEFAAGIGGGNGSGGGGNASDITISGGTVKADGGAGGAGIGSGAYASDPSGIKITGGSVKAKGGNDSVNEGAAIGGGVRYGNNNEEINGTPITPKNSDGKEVYLLTIANPNSKDVYIDGKKWNAVNNSGIDSSDTNLYAYVTGEAHTVKVGSDEVVLHRFDTSKKTFPTYSLTIYATNGEKLTYGTDYTYTDGVLTVKTSKAVTIKNTDGTATAVTDTIAVESGVSANITLAGVNIDVSSKSDTAAFKIADNSTGNVTITLAEGSTNTLRSGDDCAGIQKNGDGGNIGKLTINGSGFLEVRCGNQDSSTAAAIGSVKDCNAANIEISGKVAISAISRNKNKITYAIGAGVNGKCSDIVVKGGSIQAVSSSNTFVAEKGDNDTLDLLTFSNKNGYDITIDGQEYPKSHGSNKSLYVFLKKNTPHTIKVGDSETIFSFGENGLGSYTCYAPEKDTTEFTYNGQEQIYKLTPSPFYTITASDGAMVSDKGEIKATDAGIYTIKVKLNTSTLMKWSDDSTEEKTYTFTIKKAQSIEITEPKLSYNELYVGEKISACGIQNGWVLTNPDEVLTEAGTKTVTATFNVNTDNFEENIELPSGYKYDSTAKTLIAELSITVKKAKPEITINTNKFTANPGDTIKVNACNAKNPYSNDPVSPILYLKVGSDEEQQLTNTEYTVPSDIADKTKITFIAKTEETTGCEAASAETYVVVTTCTHDKNTNKKYQSDDSYHWIVCSECGAQTSKETHNTLSAATCTHGTTCTVCGKAHGALNRTNHIEGYKKLDSQYHVKYCKECGKELAEKVTHSFSGNICSVCSYNKSPSSGSSGGGYSGGGSSSGNREPINENTGTSGFDGIVDELKEAENGDTITIDMNGKTVVPAKILEAIKDKDITIVLDMDNGFTWTINGKDVTDPKYVDMGVSLGTTIPVSVLNMITGELSYITITLDHEGEFGFKAVLTVSLDAKNSGYFANLYYFKGSSDTEFISSGKIDNTGFAKLTFTHASEYVLLIDDHDHASGSASGETSEPTTSEPTSEPTSSEPTSEPTSSTSEPTSSTSEPTSELTSKPTSEPTSSTSEPTSSDTKPTDTEKNPATGFAFGFMGVGLAAAAAIATVRRKKK